MPNTDIKKTLDDVTDLIMTAVLLKNHIEEHITRINVELQHTLVEELLEVYKTSPPAQVRRVYKQYVRDAIESIFSVSANPDPTEKRLSSNLRNDNISSADIERHFRASCLLEEAAALLYASSAEDSTRQMAVRFEDARRHCGRARLPLAVYYRNGDNYDGIDGEATGEIRAAIEELEGQTLEQLDIVKCSKCHGDHGSLIDETWIDCPVCTG